MTFCQPKARSKPPQKERLERNLKYTMSDALPRHKVTPPFSRSRKKEGGDGPDEGLCKGSEDPRNIESRRTQGRATKGRSTPLGPSQIPTKSTAYAHSGS